MSLKWGQPCWSFSALSCSLLSTEFGSELLSGPDSSSSSSEEEEGLCSLFSANGGFLTILTRILRPFTIPHVSSAVISSSLSLVFSRSTLKKQRRSCQQLSDCCLYLLIINTGCSAQIYISFFVLGSFVACVLQRKICLHDQHRNKPTNQNVPCDKVIFPTPLSHTTGLLPKTYWNRSECGGQLV